MLERVKRAWRRHGPSEFVRLVGLNIYHVLRGPFVREDRSFDAAHGTETSKIREIGSLRIDSPSAIHAVRYQPSPAALVEDVLGGLQLRHADYVFVDYGSGKGRVLLAASRFPFARILGVEFSRELHEIARRNVAAHANCDSSIELICEDVLRFDPPREPLVCYFYNPFDEVVLRAVLDRLKASFESNPRPMFAVYVDPVHSKVFEDLGWVLQEERSSARIYKLAVGSPSETVALEAAEQT